VPVSRTANFTSYTRGSFGQADQEELARVYRELDARGCLLMLSNSDTPLARKLYAGFSIHRLNARRNINSKGDRRGPVSELVVLNYKP
jgi:DNA adenine methylase